MTRKDYVRLAGAIRLTRSQIDDMPMSTPHRVAMHVAVNLAEENLAGVLGAENIRFDSDRFAEACKGGAA